MKEKPDKKDRRNGVDRRSKLVPVHRERRSLDRRGRNRSSDSVYEPRYYGTFAGDGKVGKYSEEIM